MPNGFNRMELERGASNRFAKGPAASRVPLDIVAIQSQVHTASTEIL